MARESAGFDSQERPACAGALIRQSAANTAAMRGEIEFMVESSSVRESFVVQQGAAELVGHKSDRFAQH